MFWTYDALPVVVAAAVVGPVVVAGVVVLVVPPKAKPPAPVAVPLPTVTVPVHVAPLGQHAIFLALSSVQNVPAVQQAPASAFAKVEQELWSAGQLPSLFSRSCLWSLLGMEVALKSNPSSGA